MKIKFTALLVISFMLMTSSCASQTVTDFGDDQMLVKDYIEENISSISQSDPVLGGTWYVVDVEFMDSQTVKITYEDGHIQKIITANYKISIDKNVDLEVLSEMDV